MLSTEKAGVTAIEGKKPLGNFQSAGRSAAEVLSDAINLVDAGEDQRITIGKLPNSAITARGNGQLRTENGSGVTPFIQGTRYSGKVIDIEAKALQSFEGPDAISFDNEKKARKAAANCHLTGHITSAPWR